MSGECEWASVGEMLSPLSDEPAPVGPLRRSSLFNPTVEKMRADVIATNERCERLALRIGEARRALRQGQPAEAVIAILDGASA